MKRVLLIAVIWALTGCATISQDAITLTILSEPLGAMLYINNEHIGTTPLKRLFRINDQHRAANEIKVAPITAMWVSGATTTASIFLSLSHGPSQKHTLFRPYSHPGMDKDLARASEIKTKIKQDEYTAHMRKQAADNNADGESAAIFLQFLGAAIQGYNAGKAGSYVPPASPSSSTANQPAQVIKKIEAPKSYNCRSSYSGSDRYVCDER